MGWAGESVGSRNQFAVFDKAYFVSAGKLRRYHGQGWWRPLLDIKSIFLNLRDSFRVILGIWQARKLVDKLKPDVVFSKGSFVAFPIGLAAHWRSVPIVTHDSDALPGLANRLLSRWAAKMATGFPVENYGSQDNRTVFVGVPITTSAQAVDAKLQAQFRRQLGLPAEGLILLTGGAGHGSAALNNLTIKAAPELLRRFPSLTIVHLTGQKHLVAVKAAYDHELEKSQRLRVKAIGFTDKFEACSGAADLIISRAGASSLALFAAQAKACLIIPAPWLAGGHQLRNAEYLQAQQAIASADNNVSVSELSHQVSVLLSDPKKRQKLAQNLHKFSRPNATSDLAKLIIEVAKTSHGSA